MLSDFLSYPFYDAGQSTSSTIFFIFCKSVWFKLVVLRILHTPEKLISFRIVKNAQRSEILVSSKTNKAWLLCSNQHSGLSHKPDFARQSIFDSNPQSTVSQIQILLFGLRFTL